jgi:hypothetical protein
VVSRQKLHELALIENGIQVDARDKEVVFEDAEDALWRAKLIADVCVGAFFAKHSDKEREQERVRRMELVQRWLAERNGKASALESELRELQRGLCESQMPFHWPIEFPDIFVDERPDPLAREVMHGASLMDAFVGNPPFAGKDTIVEMSTQAYQDWLRASFEGERGVRGNCDLSAYFFRQACALSGSHGGVGFVSTNTIAQGDTRSIGLQHILDYEGWTISHAVISMPWPGVGTAVTVAIVNLLKGNPANAIVHVLLDDLVVPRIDSRLQSAPSNEIRADPSKLAVCKDCAFQGSVVLGTGFTLTPEEREALVHSDGRNSIRISPYLGGEEVNSSPIQAFERYVISFEQMSLAEAGNWSELLAIVRAKVKPERDKQKGHHSTSRRRRDIWWQFDGVRAELYNAIAPLSRCLVTGIVSKHLMFSFQPTDRVFSHKLYVFPFDHYSPFAVLQSRIHAPWAWLLSSTMGKSGINYSASTCFETFPFPESNPRTVIPALEQLGEELYTTRAKYMLETQQGLTKTYNALKDPACTDARIIQLRKLHERMDAAVLRAYGWSDLTVPPFCIANDRDKAALETFKREVIDRLFALNAERAQEEARLGLGKPTKGSAKKKALRATPPERPQLKPTKSTRPNTKIASSPPARKRRSVNP